MRTWINYPSVAATLALVLAMAGGAYAVATAPKDSVVSKSIKNGQVKPNDLSAKAANPAYFSESLGQTAITASSYDQLAALMAFTDELPSGKYVISATANTILLNAGANCRLEIGDDSYEVELIGSGSEGTTNVTGSLAMQTAHTIPKGAGPPDNQIALLCIMDGGFAAAVQDIRISAIRVGSIEEI